MIGVTPRPRPHVWRYDATTPAVECPWVVSHHWSDDPRRLDPERAEAFPTWPEAMAYACAVASGALEVRDVADSP